MNTFPNDAAGAGPDLKKARRRKTAGAAAIDRLPPHDAPSEKAVLGCQLLAPNEAIPEVIQKFKGCRFDAHYDLRHQIIQAALFELYEARTGIDAVTLQAHLKNKGYLEQAGGITYLLELEDAVPSAANLSYWLEEVREKWLLRKMVQTCTEVVGRVYEYEGEVDTLLDQVEADILAVNDLRTAASGPKPMTTLVADDLVRIENMKRGVGTVSGLRTYLGHLDKWTSGLHDGEITVVAARPSVGKTSLLTTIAANVCRWGKMPAAFFSMEMSEASLVRRLLCAEAQVNSHNLRTGFATVDDMKALEEVAPRVAKFPLHIDDTPSLGILELKARARRMVSQHGVRLIGVDYLQLMHGVSGKNYHGNRVQEISDISAGLKSLARELNIPVLVLSQLNREVERSKARKPQLSDLRDSGAIEQDADGVWLLYRPGNRKDPDTGQIVEVPDEADPDEVTQPVNLLIGKQRNGPSDWDVELTFFKPYTYFADAYSNRGRIAGNAPPAEYEKALQRQ